MRTLEFYYLTIKSIKFKDSLPQDKSQNISFIRTSNIKRTTHDFWGNKSSINSSKNFKHDLLVDESTLIYEHNKRANRTTYEQSEKANRADYVLCNNICRKQLRGLYKREREKEVDIIVLFI